MGKKLLEAKLKRELFATRLTDIRSRRRGGEP